MSHGRDSDDSDVVRAEMAKLDASDEVDDDDNQDDDGQDGGQSKRRRLRERDGAQAPGVETTHPASSQPESAVAGDDAVPPPPDPHEEGRVPRM